MDNKIYNQLPIGQQSFMINVAISSNVLSRHTVLHEDWSVYPSHPVPTMPQVCAHGNFKSYVNLQYHMMTHIHMHVHTYIIHMYIYNIVYIYNIPCM